MYIDATLFYPTYGFFCVLMSELKVGALAVALANFPALGGLLTTSLAYVYLYSSVSSKFFVLSLFYTS